MKKYKPPNLFKGVESININGKRLKFIAACCVLFIFLIFIIDIDMPISGKARVIPSEFVTVEAKVAGVIKDLNVTSGDRIKKNALIGHLHNNELIKDLKEAKLEKDMVEKKLLQLEKKLNYLKVMVERNERLYKEDVIAQAEFEKIKLDYDSELQEFNIYKDQKEALENEIEYLNESLENTKIVSPITGIIVDNIEDRIGTYVEEGDKICEIANVDEVFLELPVDEKVIKRIKVGDDVSVSFLSYPDKPISGKVVKIHHVAWEKLRKVVVKENVINVLIRPDSMPFQPKIGMRAEVKIHCGKLGLQNWF